MYEFKEAYFIKYRVEHWFPPGEKWVRRAHKYKVSYIGGKS